MYCVYRRPTQKVKQLAWGGPTGWDIFEQCEFQQGQRTDQICKGQALAAQTQCGLLSVAHLKLTSRNRLLQLQGILSLKLNSTRLKGPRVLWKFFAPSTGFYPTTLSGHDPGRQLAHPWAPPSATSPGSSKEPASCASGYKDVGTSRHPATKGYWWVWGQLIFPCGRGLRSKEAECQEEVLPSS